MHWRNSRVFGSINSPNPVTEIDYTVTLETAHGYQIGASRGELQPRWFGNAEFLARAPNLLVLSSNGAGYDTIDVDACTAAGVLAVNQAGGNAEGVAEHARALMLNLTKRIMETDRYMRRQADIEKNNFMGRNLEEKTVGLIGIGHVGTRVAEFSKMLFKARVLACDPYLTAEQIAARAPKRPIWKPCCESLVSFRSIARALRKRLTSWTPRSSR